MAAPSQSLSFKSFLKENKEAGMLHTWSTWPRNQESWKEFYQICHLFTLWSSTSYLRCVSVTVPTRKKSSQVAQETSKTVKGWRESTRVFEHPDFNNSLKLFLQLYRPCKRRKCWFSRDLVRYDAVKEGLDLRNCGHERMTQRKPISQLKTWKHQISPPLFSYQYLPLAKPKRPAGNRA